jgi:hypothetical protein
MKALRSLVLAAALAVLSVAGITAAHADQFSFARWYNHAFTQDFDRYAAAEWVVTKVGTGTNALSTIDGGALLLTTTTASGDNVLHQLTTETFSWDSTKKLYCAARLKVDNATNAQWLFGLQITDTTPFAVSDGIWFDKPAAATAVGFHVAKASTQTDVTGIATQANDTFNVYEFYYDGSTMSYFVDGVKLGVVPTTNIPTRTLTVSFGVQAGTAAARTMTVDLVECLKER